MKNFLRALRHALPYRRRLVMSIVCAACAAMLWGLNFTAIYPVLQLLKPDQNAQNWVRDKIETLQNGPNGINTLDRLTNEKGAEEGKLQDNLREARRSSSETKYLEQKLRDLNNEQARLENKLEFARRWLYLYQILQKYIDEYVSSDSFVTLAWVIGIVVVGVAIKCCFEFGQESLVGSVVNLALFDLRNRFYRNVIHLDVDQFNEHGTSEMMARFTNDMDTLGTGLKMLFGKVVAEPLKALSCMVLACFISWQLTLMFLILVPVAVFILARVGRLMKQATRRLLERMSNIYKILQESFQGIRVVKAFTMEPYERRRFCTATKDYYRKSMQVVNIDALADPIIEMLGVATVAVALLAGSYLVQREKTHIWGVRLSASKLEPESMLNLYILLAAIADPVRKLSSVFTRIQSAGAAADRIFAFLDRQPRVRGNSDGPRLERPAFAEAAPGAGARPGRPYIEFRDVCFSYDPERPILTNINLSFRAGETIAIVGSNGCGKTTLAGLIPRFYDPDHGSILIDGHDLRTVHLRSLRQQIGVVTQEVILFDDTIYNNIAYGTRAAKQEEVEAAARRAFAHDFIEKQPQAYQTRLGEAGNKLSVGQKQRLALARAILRNPSILILDEFTSASDPESEALIHRAMNEFKRDRTTFLITHRLHTLEIADRILVLENGRVAALGTHTELIGGCLAYQRLHEAQGQRLCA